MHLDGGSGHAAGGHFTAKKLAMDHGRRRSCTDPTLSAFPAWYCTVAHGREVFLSYRRWTFHQSGGLLTH
jgi:hypothetical protein